MEEKNEEENEGERKKRKDPVEDSKFNQFFRVSHWRQTYCQFLKRFFFSVLQTV